MPPEVEETGEAATLDSLSSLLLEPVNGGKTADGAPRASAAPPEDADDLEDTDGLLTDDDPDGAANAEEGEKPDDDKDGDDPSTEPLYTVKIDGKEEQVTLKEALAGYQRQKDYTQSKMQLAEIEKARNDEIVAARESRLHYESLVKHIADRLDGVEEMSAQDWADLRARDEIEYATKWAERQQRMEQRALVQAEQRKLAEQSELERQAALAEFVASQRPLLLERIPAWKDEKRRESDLAKARAHAKEEGFTDEEIENAYDARMVKLLNDSRILKEIRAKQAAAKAQVEKAPAMAAPGKRSTPMSGKTKTLLEGQKRFDRTGKPEDGVWAILQ